MTSSTPRFEMVRRAIQNVSEAAREATIRPETRLVEDLALDSLDMVAVLLGIQDEHGVEFDLDAVRAIETVADLMSELDRHLSGQSSAA